MVPMNITFLRVLSTVWQYLRVTFLLVFSIQKKKNRLIACLYRTRTIIAYTQLYCSNESTIRINNYLNYARMITRSSRPALLFTNYSASSAAGCNEQKFPAHTERQVFIFKLARIWVKNFQRQTAAEYSKKKRRKTAIIPYRIPG